MQKPLKDMLMILGHGLVLTLQPAIFRVELHDTGLEDV